MSDYRPNWAPLPPITIINRFTIISGNLANNVFRALHFHTSANNLANNYETLAQIYLVIILSHKRSNLLNVSQFSLF